MNKLFKYSLRGITILFVSYLLALALLRNTIYHGEELPIAFSFFSYALCGFWAGMLFMSFLYRNARKDR